MCFHRSTMAVISGLVDEGLENGARVRLLGSLAVYSICIPVAADAFGRSYG